MKRLGRTPLSLLIVLALAGCAGGAGVTTQEARVGCGATLQDEARALADAWMLEHPPQSLDWSWGEGVLAFGLLHAARSLSEPRYERYVLGFVQHHVQRGLRVRWSDDTTPALAAAELALSGHGSARPAVEQVVTYVLGAPRTSSQGLVRHLGERVPAWFLPRRLPDVWIDSIFHIVPTLTRYTQLTGEPRYREEGVRQLEGFVRNLQDPATGLFTHAYNDHPRDAQIPAFAARAFWARGNGWMAVTLVDTLQQLPPDHSARGELTHALTRQLDAVAALQSPGGLFHTVLLDPSSYEETAGSALLTYAFAMAAQGRLYDPERAQHVAGAGMRGLRDRLRVSEGQCVLSGTSVGTNPRSRYARVRQRSQVSYGVGSWLLAASALLGEPAPR